MHTCSPLWSRLVTHEGECPSDDELLAPPGECIRCDELRAGAQPLKWSDATSRKGENMPVIFTLACKNGHKKDYSEGEAQRRNGTSCDICYKPMLIQGARVASDNPGTARDSWLRTFTR
jgi:hypothetical protein